MSGDDEAIEVELKSDDSDDPKSGDKDAKFSYDEDESNLVETFRASEKGRRWLRKIARRVLDDFERDSDSSAEYRKRMADDFKIFAGVLPPKTWPHKHSANAHLPYMLENISRLTMRAEAELFGDWKSPFGVVRVGTTPEEDEIVDVLTVHGNWQLREQLPDFRRQVGKRGLLLFFCAGDVTCHSYYDSARLRNCHEMLTADDFITPYTLVTTQPDYSDLPHHTRIFWRYRHELQAMRDVWFGIDNVLEREVSSWDDDPETRLSDAVAEVHSIDVPTDDKGAPYCILQYEGWIEMPPSEQDTQKDAEDRDRFMQVTIDKHTRRILCLQVFEEPGWQEKERFLRQTQELDQFHSESEMYEQASQQVQQQVEQLQVQMQMGMVDPASAQSMIAYYQQQLQMQSPPVPPPWLEGEDPATGEVAPMRKDPIHMYSHGVCIEPLKGNLGLSYGRIQADYNRAADTSLSQFIDSATAANVWSMITDNQVQFEDGFEISPNKVNKATGFSGKLSDHIMELRPAPANPQMFDLVRFMSEIAQSSIQAPAVLSGESGKSGETYRGISTRIEQATKQLTVATQTYGEFVRQIMKNNARLNAAFLPEEEMRYLMDYKLGTLRHIKVERRLYERNYDVTFASDLRYAPQAQRIAEADEVTQMALSTPVLQPNLAFAYEAIKRSLQARGRDDLVLQLGAKPPVPPVFGMPSMPMPMPGQQPGQPPQPGQHPGHPPAGPKGQQQGETAGDGGGMRPPSPGVQGGPAPRIDNNPAPRPQQMERPPGTGGPVAHSA